MLFTRTIRRKMVFGLALILAMLLTLSLSGFSSLTANRELIDEFEFSISKAPLQSDLMKAALLLYEPLALKSDVENENEEFARHQQGLFQAGLISARRTVTEFHEKMDDLPPTPAAREYLPVTKIFLADIEERLNELDEMGKSLGDPELRSSTVQTMLGRVVELHDIALKAPIHHEGLRSALGKAGRKYRWQLLVIECATGIVLLLFLALVRYGYTGVFSPLKKLHQGALRVAQGDFDYRVDISTDDEMAELASAFNRMTARFQEITRDLDRQVRERSKQLVRSERLAGIGLFSAGVAHEINNPLNAIATAAEALEYRELEAQQAKQSQAALFLEKQNPRDQQPPTEASGVAQDEELMRSYLKIIQKEAFRCQDITRKLLDFARGQDAVRTSCDLTNIINEVISLVSLMSKYRDRTIGFSMNHPCEIEINGPEIKQVVLNLVTNALESMQSGQALLIDMTEDTDQVNVVFTDEGCGITPEMMDNLFEPFYTRRKDGRGTGLGLSISNRIIADHGGTIEVSSEGPGQGSTFVVRLPRKAASSTVAA